MQSTQGSSSGINAFAGAIVATNLSGTNTGDITLAAVGAVPNANAASLTGQALALQPADATNPGVVTTAAQTFAGAKTFAIIDLPTTTSTAGMITRNGTRYLHGFGPGGPGANGNLFIGFNSGNFTLSSTGNLGIGKNVQTALTFGAGNTSLGFLSAEKLTTGNNNTSAGAQAFANLTTGFDNTALGPLALAGLVSGWGNLGIGYQAGTQYLSSENNNLCICSPGVTGESTTTRLGSAQTTCYIAGISGVTTTYAAIAVYVDAYGQLGTVSSDRNLKENITYDIEEESQEIIKRLRPAKYAYRADSDKKMVYGLIAQDVQEVLPEFVVRVKTPKKKSTLLSKIASKLKGEKGEAPESRARSEETEGAPQTEAAEESGEETHLTIQHQYLQFVMIKEMQRMQKVIEETQETMKGMQKQIDELSRAVHEKGTAG
jgi:endosialidase-like protein